MNDQQLASHDLPPIGSSAREKLELICIDVADEALRAIGCISQALLHVHNGAITAGWSQEAAIELENHVEDVWVSRILD